MDNFSLTLGSDTDKTQKLSYLKICLLKYKIHSQEMLLVIH